MSFHLIEMHRIAAVGGATAATYERLMREAEGAQPGSPAFMAKVAFERAWLADSAALIARCEGESNIIVMFPEEDDGSAH